MKRQELLVQCVLLLVPTSALYIPGDCVLEAVDTSAVPNDTLCKIGPIETYQATRFQEKQMVYGLTLLGSFASQSTLAVDFCWIATTIADMFASSPDIDAANQAAVLRRMYRRKAGVPIFEAKDGNEDAMFETMPDPDQAARVHSMCDVIISNLARDRGNQTFEVIEHVLHAYNNAGLALEFPADWGASKSSNAWTVLQSAVSQGFFDISDYEQERAEMGEESFVRIVIQEFHWLLTGTAWELWGADGSYIWNKQEWPQLYTITQLQSRFPEGWALHERTTAKVMQKPRQSTIDGIKTLKYELRDTAACTMPSSRYDGICTSASTSTSTTTSTTTGIDEQSASGSADLSTSASGAMILALLACARLGEA